MCVPAGCVGPRWAHVSLLGPYVSPHWARMCPPAGPVCVSPLGPCGSPLGPCGSPLGLPVCVLLGPCVSPPGLCVSPLGQACVSTVARVPAVASARGLGPRSYLLCPSCVVNRESHQLPYESQAPCAAGRVCEDEIRRGGWPPCLGL